MTTSSGQSIRFSETDVRPMGRTARGVVGIKLKKEGDIVVGATRIPFVTKNISVLAASEKGYGKRTEVDEYRPQNRGGSGILTYKMSSKTGKLVSARLIDNKLSPDILVATQSGKVIRLAVKQIPLLGRATMGVKLIKLAASDKVTSVAVMEPEVNDEEENNSNNKKNSSKTRKKSNAKKSTTKKKAKRKS
jgi:DNA gyrase subunit A